jgi:hypothetical protein
MFPESKPGDINTPSSSKFSFVFSFPDKTHNEKDTTKQQALLLKMSRLPPPRHSPSPLYGLSDVELADTIPATRAGASSQHGSSVGQYVAPATLWRWAEAPQEPSTVFDNYRRNQTSRYREFFRARASQHVEECHFCQTRQFNDAECPIRRVMSPPPASVRQTPPYSYTPPPQAGDGPGALPMSSDPVEPSLDVVLPPPLFDNPQGMSYYPGQDMPRYPLSDVQAMYGPQNSDEEYEVVPSNHVSEGEDGEDFKMVSKNSDAILGASGSEYDDGNDNDDDDDDGYTPDEDEENEDNEDVYELDRLDYEEELVGLNRGEKDEDE